MICYETHGHTDTEAIIIIQTLTYGHKNTWTHVRTDNSFFCDKISSNYMEFTAQNPIELYFPHSIQFTKKAIPKALTEIPNNFKKIHLHKTEPH